MSVKDKALFLYGFNIDNNNKYINFQNISAGPEITGVMTIGNYTATGFAAEIKRAMEAADTVYKYSVTIDRTINSGASNLLRVSCITGTYLSLLFGTGTNNANSPIVLMGFNHSDYTGSLSYSGYTNCGTILVPDFPTWNYLGVDSFVTNDGVKNISASGIKETLVFAQMYFFQGQWKYITNFSGSTQLTQWQNFLKYATRQLKLEFTPSIYEDPTVFYQCTLESTPSDSNGMGYMLKQQLGEGLYRFYDTGVMKFRQIPT